MKKFFIWTSVIFFLLACQTLLPKETARQNNSALVSPSQFVTATQIFIPTHTPTTTFAPSPTLTASPTPTLEWLRQGPDAVTVPILLYHRIETSSYNSQYYVAPNKFEEQIALLRNWGYTTITLDLLLKSIYEGADLPARPILLTFDDGQVSVYTNAFPIMKKYGYIGIVYIVGTYMDAPTFMTTEQVKELAQAGWEVGSHSMRHKDLTALTSEEQTYEISESRKLLSEKIGVPVNSFAYPFGFSNDDIFPLVYKAGYTSAMGLGYTNNQGRWNILLLQRRDIKGTYDLKQFISFLPWQGDPSFLPTDTPTPIPTPTRTPRATKVK